MRAWVHNIRTGGAGASFWELVAGYTSWSVGVTLATRAAGLYWSHSQEIQAGILLFQILWTIINLLWTAAVFHTFVAAGRWCYDRVRGRGRGAHAHEKEHGREAVLV